MLLNKQIALFEANGPTSTSYKHVSLFGRFFGGAAGLIVTKPTLAW